MANAHSCKFIHPQSSSFELIPDPQPLSRFFPALLHITIDLFSAFAYRLYGDMTIKEEINYKITAGLNVIIVRRDFNLIQLNNAGN